MGVSSGWRTASLVAGALLIGSVLGPPLAQAVSAGLVRIEDGHSSNLAAVSKSGRLSVNAGLTTTTAGQVTVAGADPRSLVAVLGNVKCAAGGIYRIPAGKALIITGATFFLVAESSSPHELVLETGTVTQPCFERVAGAQATEPDVSQNQVFSPGIPVPAGDAVGLVGGNDAGSALLYGYLVPAAAVPASALQNVRAAQGGPIGMTPPR